MLASISCEVSVTILGKSLIKRKRLANFDFLIRCNRAATKLM